MLLILILFLIFLLLFLLLPAPFACVRMTSVAPVERNAYAPCILPPFFTTHLSPAFSPEPPLRTTLPITTFPLAEYAWMRLKASHALNFVPQ